MPTKPVLLIAKDFYIDSLEYIEQELSQYFSIIVPESFTDASLSSHISIAEYVLGHQISDSLLYKAKNLRYFQCVSSGLDHLNLSLFQKLHIEIGNSTSHAPHVAKYALALMLNIACQITLNDTNLRYAAKRPTNLSNGSVSSSPCFFGENVGLIGYGAINKCIEQLLKPFGSHVYHYRQRTDSSSSSLSEIFSFCKYIFIALPLNSQTKSLVNEELLLDNHTSPYLVNVSRAEVIDRTSLIKSLKHNTISGFASDVAYGQDLSSPLGFDGLYEFPNVILSPHRAASIIGLPSYLPGAVNKLVEALTKSC